MELLHKNVTQLIHKNLGAYRFPLLRSLPCSSSRLLEPLEMKVLLKCKSTTVMHMNEGIHL